jgi:small-conductance mechanosensitive channel
MKRFYVKDAVKSIRAFSDGISIVDYHDSGKIIAISTEYTTIRMNNGNEVTIKNDLMEKFFIRKREEMIL